MNKVILIGNVGRDPEMRSTAGGTPIATFSLATNRRWKDRDGQRQEQTEWHSVVAFGRTAEVAGQYLSKGSRAAVEGRLQTRSWDDPQTGSKRYRTEVVVEHLELLGGGGGEGRGGRERERVAESSYGERDGDYDGYGGGGGLSDDDIPY